MRSKRLPDNEIEGYVQRLKSGSYEARDALIESHVPLVLAIAKNYLNRFPNLREEIISVAKENLSRKIEKIRLGESLTSNNNIGAFINKSTSLAIRHFLREQMLRSQRKNILNEYFQRKAPSLVFNEALTRLVIDEIMGSQLFSDLEKRLIELRIQGYTDEEIAEQMHMSQQRVCRVRNQLKNRLESFV
jgi:RNA polymerase sigma factor (sigma-70 family)